MLPVFSFRSGFFYCNIRLENLYLLMNDFVQHYEAHKNRIFTYLLYRVSFDRELAEDLTSDVFLKAFEHFDSYDQARPFKPWIFRIAHNHLVNYFASRKQTVSLEDAEELSVPSTVSEQAETNLLMGKIETFVKDLPVSQQELILLRYQNGLSHREIADIVGKEEGAVRTAISRALDTIRNRYHQSLPPLQ